MSSIADINAETRSLCDADSTSYIAADLLRRVNYGYEQVIGWIINADGTWQWDDTNYTNFPIGTLTLTAGTGRYSFNDRFLQLEEVQVRNSAGDYIILDPIDQKEYSSYSPLSEDFETAGFPQYYDKVADDTIQLFPPPSATAVTLASGLRIKFKRTADLYTSAQVTTGTKVPGFASPYHVILSWMAARPFCAVYKKDLVPWLNTMIGDLTPVPTGMKKAIIEHYGRRQKDQRKVATMRWTPYR